MSDPSTLIVSVPMDVPGATVAPAPISAVAREAYRPKALA